MELRWMFRVEDMSGHRGTLAVFLTNHDEWEAVFDSDVMRQRVRVERPMLDFRSASGDPVQLYRSSDPFCRSLGEAKSVSLYDLVPGTKPKLTFTLLGRFPVTASVMKVVTASAKVRVGIKGG